jgi:laminin alpha 1/2
MSATIHNSGKINNEMSAQITKMSNSESRQSVQDSANLIDNVLDNVRNTDKEVNEISENVAILREKLSELDPEWDSKFGLAEENIAKSLINIREANKMLNTNEQRIGQQQEKFKAWNGTLSGKLQELRDKITKAKHAAESVSSILEPQNHQKYYTFHNFRFESR